MRLVHMTSTLFALLFAGASAHATLILHASLDNEQEGVAGVTPTTSTGAPRPASFGEATFELDDTETHVTMLVTVFNIDVTGTQTPDTNDDLVNAHIHVGALPHSIAPVRWGFFGSPDNDNNPDQLVVVPFAGAVGGTFSSIWDQPEGNAGTTLTTNLPGILAGLSYINFHTVQFAGGEIRGQIAPVSEPSTALLLPLVLMMAFAARRPRKARP
jgi:CHRD domain